MTQMKNKSVDARRTRRHRYKDAVKPVIEEFGCTSMQVAARVRHTLLDNKRLDDENARLRKSLEDSGFEIVRLRSDLASSEAALKEWKAKSSQQEIDYLSACGALAEADRKIQEALARIAELESGDVSVEAG